MLVNLVLLCCVSAKMRILSHHVAEMAQILRLPEDHPCVLRNAHHNSIAHRHTHRHLHILPVALTQVLRLRILAGAACLCEVALGCLAFDLGSE